MKKFVMLDDLQEKVKQCHTRKDIDRFIKKHRKVEMLGDVIINAAETRIANGDYDGGIVFIIAVYESKHLKDYDEITVYLRLAEYYIENGDIEKGKVFLIHLCNDTVENYEEALKFRNLLSVWEKYKKLVMDCVKPSISLEDDNGDMLSPEELLDELLSEVCSGGFDSYLTYHSDHFEEALKAAESLNKPLTAELLKRITEKFPYERIPVNKEEAEAIIEDCALDFEEEDNYFYDVIEKELSDL